MEEVYYEALRWVYAAPYILMFFGGCALVGGVLYRIYKLENE